MMADAPGVMRMADVGRELVASLYETVLTIRRFEQRGIEQYRLGNIRGYFHPYLGEEAIAAGAIGALRPDDYIVSTHRGHGHAIAKGHDPRLMMAELFGRETGYCRLMCLEPCSSRKRAGSS